MRLRESSLGVRHFFANGFAQSQPLHDDAGNLIYDGRRTFTYDAWNRLTEVRIDDGDGATGAGDTLVATFAYDGLGRRVSKTVDNAADWDCTYHYYYDTSWRRIEMRDGSNQVLKQYVYGTRYVDNPVQIGVNTDPGEDDDAEETGTQDYCDDFYYPVQDANFNVTGLVDSGGDLVERYEYTPYGQRAVFKNAGSSDETTSAPLYESQRVACGLQPAAWSICDLGHQGLLLDKEIGLYDNRRRVLQPRFGRFMQRDPIGYADGMGLYEYTSSSPNCRLDPTGLGSVLEGIYAWENSPAGHPDAGHGMYASEYRAFVSTIRQRAAEAIHSVRRPDRHYSLPIGLPTLADKLQKGLDHVVDFSPWPPAGATGRYLPFSNTMEVPRNASERTLIEELNHAYHDSAWWAYGPEYSEALAAAIDAILTNLGSLDAVENTIRRRGPCKTVKTHWKEFWDVMARSFGGDRYAVTFQWTELVYLKHDRKLTYNDVQEAMDAMGLKISCTQLEGLYNGIMEAEGVLDEEKPGQCCKVRCPEDLPPCFK